MKNKTVSKTVRLPIELIDFINSAPGKSFTDKIIYILNLYHSSIDFNVCSGKVHEESDKFTGRPGEWYQDDKIGGYYADDGHLVVCEEYGSDEDFDRYSTEVQNGLGFYDSNGKFVRYGERE